MGTTYFITKKNALDLVKSNKIMLISKQTILEIQYFELHLFSFLLVSLIKNQTYIFIFVSLNNHLNI